MIESERCSLPARHEYKCHIGLMYCCHHTRDLKTWHVSQRTWHVWLSRTGRELSVAGMRRVIEYYRWGLLIVNQYAAIGNAGKNYFHACFRLHPCKNGWCIPLFLFVSTIFIWIQTLPQQKLQLSLQPQLKVMYIHHSRDQRYFNLKRVLNT